MKFKFLRSYQRVKAVRTVLLIFFYIFWLKTKKQKFCSTLAILLCIFRPPHHADLIQHDEKHTKCRITRHWRVYRKFLVRIWAILGSAGGLGAGRPPTSVKHQEHDFLEFCVKKEIFFIIFLVRKFPKKSPNFRALFENFRKILTLMNPHWQKMAQKCNEKSIRHDLFRSNLY